MKIVFKWFDFWIGIFIDTKKELLYILPIPMVGVKINLAPAFDWVFRTFGTVLLLNVFKKHTEDGDVAWGRELVLFQKRFYRKMPPMPDIEDPVPKGICDCRFGDGKRCAACQVPEYD